MFDHILLATDLTEVSEGAFRLATTLARAHAARLTLLCVWDVPAQALAGVPEAEAERTWPGPIRVRGKLDAIAKGLRATGLRADTVVRVGVAARRIAEVAREERVDLVVTGTHGRRGLAHLWYGSVAQQVLRRSSAPVLTVPVASGGAIAIPLCSRGPGRRSSLALASTFVEPGAGDRRRQPIPTGEEKP